MSAQLEMNMSVPVSDVAVTMEPEVTVPADIADLVSRHSLRDLLAFLCRKSPMPLKQLYERIQRIRPQTADSTVRGTIYQNQSLFRRVAPGVYVASAEGAMAVMVNGDAWELIKLLDDNSIDAIISDMPTGWCQDWRSKSSNRRGQPLNYETKTPDAALLRELLRVIRKEKPGMSLANYPKPIKGGGYMFLYVPGTTRANRHAINSFIDLAESVGWEYQKTWVAAHGRATCGLVGRVSHDAWLVFSAPNRIRGFDQSVLDVIFSKFVEARDRIHPSEKHEDTFVPMLNFATQAGDTVLDMFCGSMSMLRCALKMGRNAIGFELSHDVTARAMGEAAA